MAKKSKAMPIVHMELLEPDSNAEARMLEESPHGGHCWGGSKAQTREALDERSPHYPYYSHHHNPAQQHSRTIVKDPSERFIEECDPAEGVTFREPMRADLDDSQR